jgi:hypothetical protein
MSLWAPEKSSSNNGYQTDYDRIRRLQLNRNPPATS